MSQSNKYRKIKQKIDSAYIDELQRSHYYRHSFLVSLRRCIQRLATDAFKVSSFVCYGLGSFNNGLEIASRYQLSLQVLLYRELAQNPQTKSVIEIYDPSFDSVDEGVLGMYDKPKFEMIDKNEYCARDIAQQKIDDGFVLVYMPHLDKPFYNNLLGSNWSRESLSRLIVLGNSFTEMIDSEINASQQPDLYYLNTVVTGYGLNNRKSKNNRRRNDSTENDVNRRGCLVEIKVDDDFEHSNVFNSMSFHVFDRVWLESNVDFIERTRLTDWTPKTLFPCEQSEDWN